MFSFGGVFQGLKSGNASQRSVTAAFQRAYFSTKTGTCKWFSPTKGFGFIIPDDGGNEVFVHQTSIHASGFRSLADGEPVEFEIESDDNGRERAAKVTGPGGNFVQGAPRPPPRNAGFGGGYGGQGGYGGGYGPPGGYGGGFGGPPPGGFGGGGFGGPPPGGFGGGGFGGPPPPGFGGPPPPPPAFGGPPPPPPAGFGGGGFGGPPPPPPAGFGGSSPSAESTDQETSSSSTDDSSSSSPDKQQA